MSTTAKSYTTRLPILGSAPDPVYSVPQTGTQIDETGGLDPVGVETPIDSRAAGSGDA